MNINLKKSFEVSLAKSDFKNQAEFCNTQGISASTLQPMKKNSDQCRIGTIEMIAHKLGFSLVEFIENGKD